MLEPLRQGLPPVDPATVSSSLSCSLSARYESVKGARQFTKAALGQWKLIEQFDTVALVVSELVTNALRHAVRCDSAEEPVPDPPVRLHLMHWDSRLVCAVRDPSRTGPVAPKSSAAGQELGPDSSAESGRGLYLVDAISDSWGWQPLSGTLPGKVVWALLRLPGTAP